MLKEIELQRFPFTEAVQQQQQQQHSFFPKQVGVG